MKRIVAIVGDYYHDPDHIRQSLEQAMQLPGGSRMAEVSYVEVSSLPRILKERPDLIILFKENRVNPAENAVNSWMDTDVEEAIVRYVHDGGAFFAWHSGLASYEEDGAYCNMLRGHFVHHPAEHQIVRYRYQECAMTGIRPVDGASFEFADEHYFVVCDRSQTNVFLTSESEDGHSTAGWAHEFGAGRVACLTPAHTVEGLLHPEFGALIGSVISWLV